MEKILGMTKMVTSIWHKCTSSWRKHATLHGDHDFVGGPMKRMGNQRDVSQGWSDIARGCHGQNILSCAIGRRMLTCLTTG